MRIINLDNCINEVEIVFQHLYDNSYDNQFDSYIINNEEYILLTSEVINILHYNLLNVEEKNNLENIKSLLEQIINNGRRIDAHIFSRLLDIKDYIELEMLNKECNLNRYINFQDINNFKNNYLEINKECMYFDGFKNNQNNFDNILSMIKIINRLKIFGINYDLNKITFNTKEDNTENIRNELLYLGLKDLKNIRFYM